MPVRTRFAPSPTGSLHVGGARTALYCLLWARRSDGHYILRIEDTDQARSTEEAALGILRDLRWLHLDWDEGPGREDAGDVGPYFQSKRKELYDRHVQQLLDEGKAYEAWETREELDALRRKAEARKETFRYRRREYGDDDLARFRDEGRKPVVRLEAPPQARTIRDEILGEVTVPADDLDDLVIRKADGFPTYHFAVVVDDHHMQVSHVLRGQEHLMNTAKHLMIYEAFGWEPPHFAHLPLIFNPEGSKMSKRDKARAAREAARSAAADRGGDGWGWLAEAADLAGPDVASFMAGEHDRVSTADQIARALEVELPMIEVMDFRRGGFLPEALVNYLALLGWSPGDDREILSMGDLLEAFTLDRVQKTAARFDPDKVRWVNHEYMKSLPIERLQECLALYLEVVDSPIADIDATRRHTLLELYRERCATFAEIDEQAAFFFERPEGYDPKAVKKHLLKKDGVQRLRQLRDVLAGITTWAESSVEEALRGYGARHEVGLGKIAQPLRVALTGRAFSPGIFETVAFFEQGEALARIDACLAWVDAEHGS